VDAAVRQVRVIRYGGWAEYKRDLFPELFESDRFRPDRYLFRGSGDANWTLSSSFDRRYAQLPLDRRLALWDELIAEFRQGCADLGVPGSELDEDRKLWALGRHHGLPTRLLDWSTSPYVAAFFAFHDHLLRPSPGYDQVAVWALHLQNPVWCREYGVEIVSAPSFQNIRLRSQGGKFTLCRAPFAGLEDYVERFATEVALTQCVLPATDAEHALADLDAMGINSYTLFPDLAGLAQMATMRASLRIMMV
jgi:FRG domain